MPPEEPLPLGATVEEDGIRLTMIQLIRRKAGDRPETGWLGEIRTGPRGEVVARRTDVRTPGDCPDPTVC